MPSRSIRLCIYCGLPTEMSLIKNQVVSAMVITLCFLFSTVLCKSYCYDLLPALSARVLSARVPRARRTTGGANTTSSFTVGTTGVLALGSSVCLDAFRAIRRAVCMAISGCVGCTVRTYVRRF
jgi:hypothetical protein